MLVKIFYFLLIFIVVLFIIVKNWSWLDFYCWINKWYRFFNIWVLFGYYREVNVGMDRFIKGMVNEIIYLYFRYLRYLD